MLNFGASKPRVRGAPLDPHLTATTLTVNFIKFHFAVN